jgi:hypothetical protein
MNAASASAAADAVELRHKVRNSRLDDDGLRLRANDDDDLEADDRDSEDDVDDDVNDGDDDDDGEDEATTSPSSKWATKARSAALPQKVFFI